MGRRRNTGFQETTLARSGLRVSSQSPPFGHDTPGVSVGHVYASRVTVKWLALLSGDATFRPLAGKPLRLLPDCA